MLAEEFEVRTAIVINEEKILIRLWRIAALNNVVRLTRNGDSGHARHAENLPLAGRKANKWVTGPSVGLSLLARAPVGTDGPGDPDGGGGAVPSGVFVEG